VDDAAAAKRSNRLIERSENAVSINADQLGCAFFLAAGFGDKSADPSLSRGVHPPSRPLTTRNKASMVRADVQQCTVSGVDGSSRRVHLGGGFPQFVFCLEYSPPKRKPPRPGVAEAVARRLFNRPEWIRFRRPGRGLRPGSLGSWCAGGWCWRGG
jgi:hypothetical protein